MGGCRERSAAMSSYYNNGPRIFTPAALKTTKSFIPVENYGTTFAGVTPPEKVNTCHRSRGVSLQHTHPRTPLHPAVARPRLLFSPAERGLQCASLGCELSVAH